MGLAMKHIPKEDNPGAQWDLDCPAYRQAGFASLAMTRRGLIFIGKADVGWLTGGRIAGGSFGLAFLLRLLFLRRFLIAFRAVIGLVEAASFENHAGSCRNHTSDGALFTFWALPNRLGRNRLKPFELMLTRLTNIIIGRHLISPQQ